jgi:hypothetical protein
LPAYVFKKIILCPHRRGFYTAFLAKISICTFHEKEKVTKPISWLLEMKAGFKRKQNKNEKPVNLTAQA